MTRRSKRELESALEDLGTSETSRADAWRAFLRGEKTLDDLREEERRR